MMTADSLKPWLLAERKFDVTLSVLSDVGFLVG
jgi:hypothetical protein